MENAAFKECPFCKEQIRKEAVKCRFCGEWLEEHHQPRAGSISEQTPASQPSAPGANQETIVQSVGVDKPVSATKAPLAKPLAEQVKATATLRSAIQPDNKPLIPLFLITLLFFCYAMPLAIKNGASGVLGIALGTLRFCTTPESLFVLLILAFWFWSLRRKSLAAQTTGKSSHQVWLIIVMVVVVGVLAYASIRPALETQAAAQRQRLKASGVNPDALKGWEVLKRDQNLGDPATGLTPAAKKRMREVIALQLRGSFAAFTNLTVDLKGDDHERLIVACNNMNPTTKNVREALEQADGDFWNRMRLFDFSELVITGTNYSETISKSKFKEWSRDYDTYVSNTLAMYQDQLFDTGGNELHPVMQKALRQNFAATLDGGMKSIYKGLEVRLEGENEDKLVLYLGEMNASVADNLLKNFQEDKTGNIWNSLRALGCSELILRGDTYIRSIPRSKFIQWCRDYEKFLSQLRKVAGQISGGLEHEAKEP
jgi:hypothetical protein